MTYRFEVPWDEAYSKKVFTFEGICFELAPWGDSPKNNGEARFVFYLMDNNSSLDVTINIGTKRLYVRVESCRRSVKICATEEFPKYFTNNLLKIEFNLTHQASSSIGKRPAFPQVMNNAKKSKSDESSETLKDSTVEKSLSPINTKLLGNCQENSQPIESFGKHYDSAFSIIPAQNNNLPEKDGLPELQTNMKKQDQRKYERQQQEVQHEKAEELQSREHLEAAEAQEKTMIEARRPPEEEHQRQLKLAPEQEQKRKEEELRKQQEERRAAEEQKLQEKQQQKLRAEHQPQLAEAQKRQEAEEAVAKPASAVFPVKESKNDEIPETATALAMTKPFDSSITRKIKFDNHQESTQLTRAPSSYSTTEKSTLMLNRENPNNASRKSSNYPKDRSNRDEKRARFLASERKSAGSSYTSGNSKERQVDHGHSRKSPKRTSPLSSQGKSAASSQHSEKRKDLEKRYESREREVRRLRESRDQLYPFFVPPAAVERVNEKLLRNYIEEIVPILFSKGMTIKDQAERNSWLRKNIMRRWANEDSTEWQKLLSKAINKALS